jgi:hypothetical protein
MNIDYYYVFDRSEKIREVSQIAGNFGLIIVAYQGKPDILFLKQIGNYEKFWAEGSIEVIEKYLDRLQKLKVFL